MVKSVFTDQVVAAIRTLAAEGLSAPQIGRKLGIPRQNITKKAYRLGLKLASGTPAEVTMDQTAEIMRLYSLGTSYSRASKQVGLSVDQVRRVVERLKRFVAPAAAPPIVAREADPSDRNRWGSEPLAPFHPISWGAIMACVPLMDGTP